MAVNIVIVKEMTASVLSHVSLTLLRFLIVNLAIRVSTCNIGEMLLIR
jgi:hypothetical protein